MKVCVLDLYIGPRHIKEVTALKKLGIEFVFARGSLYHKNLGIMEEMCPVEFVEKRQDVLDVCERHRVDLIHSHNYPDTIGLWGLWAARKLGIPIVHECHDTAYEVLGDAGFDSVLRNPEYNWVTFDRLLEEACILRNADAVIAVSDGMAKYIKHSHGRDATVIHAYPPKDHLPEPVTDMPKHFRNCVYEGGILINETKGRFNHRYYEDIFQKLTDQGIFIHVYPGRDMVEAYPNPDVHFHACVQDVRQLYQFMSKYHFGVIPVNRTDSPCLNFALPNKLFEYIGCGLPILCMEFDAMAEFVRENGIGVVLGDDLRLPTDFDEQMRKAKQNVLNLVGKKYVMETQAKKLKALYEELLCQ